MRKAVLVDVDGTLLLSNEAHAQTWSQALARYGYHVSTQRIRHLIGMGGDKILPRIDPSLREGQEPGISITALRMRLFLTQCIWTLQPAPGARAFLAYLRLAGIKRIVATSAKKRELTLLLRTAGVFGEIDAATTSDDVDRSKPDADVIHSALKKGRVAPHEAVYVGDTPYDVEAARRADVDCIAVRTGGWSDRDLDGAAAIYNDPMDVLAHFNTSPIAAPVSR
jgi:HAD superfamily hydrolase (TIGR01509 family)